MENPYDFADIMKKYMKITTYNKSYSDFFKRTYYDQPCIIKNY